MSESQTFTLDESDRQATLLALAICSLDRPGWLWMLGEIAEKLDGRALFDRFRELNQDRFSAKPL